MNTLTTAFSTRLVFALGFAYWAWINIQNVSVRTGLRLYLIPTKDIAAIGLEVSLDSLASRHHWALIRIWAFKSEDFWVEDWLQAPITL
jgi:hypothetical protein